jgi:hypothetical protein
MDKRSQFLQRCANYQTAAAQLLSMYFAEYTNIQQTMLSHTIALHNGEAKAEQTVEVYASLAAATRRSGEVMLKLSEVYGELRAALEGVVAASGD